MRRIETIEDQIHGTVTYDLGNNQFVKFLAEDIALYGLEESMRKSGIADRIPTERVNVMRKGRLLGTVTATFDPLAIKSASRMYDPRPGDFTWQDDHWEAAWNLGPGDLDCVSGFERA